jgi:hypothetical protein
MDTTIKILGIFAFLVLCILYPGCYIASQETVTITVDRRERSTRGTGENMSGVYLVWSKEGEVFEVTDTVIFWKWNSADRYGALHEGERYTIEVAGWRYPIFSSYRNILSVRPAPSVAK